jgi:hypothetical protein
MRSSVLRRLVILGAVALLGLLLPLASASAQKPSVRQAVSTFTYTQNMHPLGYSPMGNTPNLPGLTFTANSDLAFWGKYAFQGHYTGFRIINIASSANPREVSFTDCNGNQGDIVVYEDILVRAWNSAAPAGSTCDGQPVPTGFEGVHIFDISDLENPELVGSVEISNRVGRPDPAVVGCGSHTITAVPDLDAGTLVVYNQSAGFCATGEQEAFHVFEIPLDDPANPTTPQEIELHEAMGCHDSGVILGDANLLACAAHEHTNVFDIGDNQFPGGSLTEPEFLYTVSEPGVCNQPGNPLCNGNWHSAAFTWDGEVLILGWEPGGGSLPECEASDPDVKKSWFFYDAKTGEKLGQFVLPRPQGATENCTVHNYNVVPTDKRYLLVGGNYQAGISVVDFTDPANAEEVAYADPAPLVPTQLGGDWSTYWYNGRIYESDITRGLIIWNLSGKWDAGARRLPYLNPQTSEFTLPSP